MIEISDLGEKSFYDIILKKKNKFNYYKNLIKIILKLQKIKIKKKYYFRKIQIKTSKIFFKKIFIKSPIYFLIGISSLVQKI